MSTESEVKIDFARYCPLLQKLDPQNLVSAHFDSAKTKTVEAYCNHTGVPRVEKKLEGIVNLGKIVAACNGCDDLQEGFEKVLETEAETII